MDEQTEYLSYKRLTWPEYDKALKRRRSLTVWFDPDLTRAAKHTGKRGRQPVYSDAAIQTCFTMKARGTPVNTGVRSAVFGARSTSVARQSNGT